jgi:hypothetical protein
MDLSPNDEETAIKILKMIPHQRSLKEAEKAGNFLHGFKFFSQFTKKLCHDMAKVCTLQECQRDLAGKFALFLLID